MANQHAAKYRPSLSVVEIKYILDLCRNDHRAETESISANLEKKLRVFSLKMQLGIVSPSHTAEEVKSLEEKLGLDKNSGVDKKQLAYNRFLVNPDICSPADMKLVALYRYENNLMTPEEESEYEDGL